MEKVIEKDMLVRGLNRIDAQDRSLWGFGCKNRLTPTCGKNMPGSRKKDLTALLEQMDEEIYYNK